MTAIIIVLGVFLSCQIGFIFYWRPEARETRYYVRMERRILNRQSDFIKKKVIQKRREEDRAMHEKRMQYLEDFDRRLNSLK